MILLLAVNPGWGGQGFNPSIPDKFKAVMELVKNKGKEIIMAIDGGITAENIEEISELKPDIVVSGSAVFKGGRTAENAKYMMDALSGNS